MTGRCIDHVVLSVHDLDAAALHWQRAGFSLTPRAFHQDSMGTSNRLIQFQNSSFIELLEVDRPDGITAHDFSKSPPIFSFGDYNRQWLKKQQGLSMLVFQSNDAVADHQRFCDRGINTYQPFRFERQATLPNGESVTVAFTLTFATSPHMPDIAFFVCQNEAPEHFWKPAYQQHQNGATALTAVTLSTHDVQRDAAFLSSLFDGDVTENNQSTAVSCGSSQQIVLSHSENTPLLDGLILKSDLTDQSSNQANRLTSTRLHWC